MAASSSPWRRPRDSKELDMKLRSAIAAIAMLFARSGGDQTLTESDEVAWAEIAWAWRWIICSMKL